MKRGGETREGADLPSSSSVVRRGEETEAVRGGVLMKGGGVPSGEGQAVEEGQVFA